jgi:hypothetical protein
MKLNINILSRLFYNCLLEENFNGIQDIIDEYTLVTLANTKNKGLISLILQYGIIIDNTEIIELIKPHLSMTRDFLHLIVYNRDDVKKGRDIFKNINIKLFLQKDVIFLIENKLYFLLPYLEGMFIKLDIKGSDIYNSKLKKITLENIDKYVAIFSMEIDNKILKQFNDVISKNYDYIIDAGNILFSQTGQIDTHSIEDLKTVIEIYPNSLIIIHKRHLKDKKISEVIQGKLFYATPPKINDDLFIILAYLKNQVNIITNDNFKDHTIDNNYLRFHINDILIKYTNDNGKFTFKPICKYTECIQVIDDCVYIPSKNGFIEFVL